MILTNLIEHGAHLLLRMQVGMVRVAVVTLLIASASCQQQEPTTETVPVQDQPKSLPVSFDASYKGDTFKVESPNVLQGNNVTVRLKMKKGGAIVTTQPFKGLVEEVRAADLNRDGLPEVYCFGRFGIATVFLGLSFDGAKSLVPISLPPPPGKEGVAHRSPNPDGLESIGLKEGVLYWSTRKPDSEYAHVLEYELSRGKFPLRFSLKRSYVLEGVLE